MKTIFKALCSTVIYFLISIGVVAITEFYGAKVDHDLAQKFAWFLSALMGWSMAYYYEER